MLENIFPQILLLNSLAVFVLAVTVHMNTRGTKKK